VPLDVATATAATLPDVLRALEARDSDPRLVLDLRDSTDAQSAAGRGRPRDMAAWAKDDLSAWGDAVIDKRGYVFMPQFKGGSTQLYKEDKVMDTVYICPEFLRREYGNRACFNKCT
jgi:hypothetical protein